MSVFSPSSRRRVFAIATGIAFVGLALASPALSRVDPAAQRVSLSITATGPTNTTVSGGQSNPRSATFVFGSSGTASSFECDVDGSGFATCANPFTADHLAYGSHTIRARALDALGNADPTPAVETFAIAAPTTTPVKNEWGPVVYAPDSLAVTSADTTTMTVAWSSVGRAGDAMSYRVSRNGVLIETDTNLSATMTGLGCGRTYTVSVVAVDAAGDASAPASIMASTVQCRTPAVPVTLSIPKSIGPGSVLSATATGPIRTVSFGYCPGQACTWATSTPIGSVSGPGQADVWWSSPPPDGTYTVVVRAVNLTGATGDANPAIVSVDTSSPDATISSGPNGFSSATANFSFTSSEAAARFECDVDGSGFFPCLANFSLTGLTGSHTLNVRTVDLAGNVDPAPAAKSWTVDVDPPHTTLIAGQTADQAVDTATFQLGSTEPGTFQCKLDNAGTFTTCTSPLSLSGFSAGLHKLTARAVDLAGNVDPTPVVANWKATAPTAAPETTITAAPPALVNSRGVLISFSSSNPLATFECSVDGATFVACLNPRPVNNLPDGAHTFAVRSLMGGLTDATPATTSFTVDATAPSVTITPSRPADGGGWYRNPVSFTTTGTDAGGAVTCTDPQTYSGPDVSHLSIVGTCTDQAGNKTTKTFDLRYDTTAPAIRVAFRVRDRNGWYNRPFNITFQGTDTGSGGVNCGPPIHYAGPDTPSGSLDGTCTDAAGNSASMSFPFAYDDTPPAVTATASRTPDVGSWYNAPLTVFFDGTDAMSGGVTCDAPVDYAGPDTGAASVSGNCMDAAGNIADIPAHVDFSYDATPPTVTAAAGRVPDHNGWYNAPTSVNFTGQDATSGGVSCDPARLYAGPDNAAATIVGSCSDAAGNYASGSTQIAYDATAPTVGVDPDRVADHNGWFNKAVTFTTHGADATSGLAGCSLPATYSAPDTAAGTQSGSCSDTAGNTGTATAGFKYDSTAPTASATPDSQPNLNGWYRAPFNVSFAGTDATSGPVTCSPASSYGGPDSAAAALSGSCQDGAGNASAPATYSFKYDATAPTVTAALDRAPDSGTWYNHGVSASFTGTDALSSVVTCDAAKSYAAPDSATASLSGTCTDAAGNQASAAKAFSYDGTAPVVTLTPDRAPDAGGAYNAPVTFTVSGSDATSNGVTCNGPVTYSGPDSSTATANGACTDAAGNAGTGSTTFSYQTSGPDTSLITTPAALTNHTTDQFTFASTKPNSTFHCTIDNVTSACTSPATVANLADGSHTFSVAATDNVGNTDSTPASFTWRVDTVVPNTTIDTTSLLNPTNQAQSFPITTDADATLQCSLDNAVFAACTSPVSVPLSSTPDGSHTFRARGIDGAGNVDATPDSFTWTVDTVAPTLTLTSTPPATSTSTTATFNWTSSESAAFSCKLDAAAFASCGSGTSGTKTLTGLLAGSHTFSVRGRDGAGNLSLTQSFTWTVDTGPPDTTIDQASKPANPTSSSSASFTFTSTKTGSTFKCKLDAAATFTTCTSPQSYTGLTNGSHTFSVEAIDSLSQVDPTPDSYTWLVDITNPTGSITAPAQNATVSGTTAVTATATDNVSVINVQFKLDGADLGAPVAAAPYTVNWDTTVAADGPHALTAVVKDEVGNLTTTAPVNVTVSNSTHPTATQSPDLVDVGPGSVDATTRNVMRTAAGRVYIIANDDNGLNTRTTAGVIHAWKGNQLGTPTAFAEADAANHPVSGGRTTATTAFGGVDVRLGSDGIARMVYNDNASSQDLIYRTFSTITDTWGTAEDIDAPIGTQERGRIKYALALDASNIPHVVWVKGTNLLYSNRATGTWSAPVTIATGVPAHPMLAFDTTGVLHLTWLEDNGSGSSLRYANRTGTTWSTPELIPTGAILSNSNADQGPSIATDSAGHPYVLYLGPSLGTFGPVGHTALYGAIKVMEKVGGTWTDLSPAPETGYLGHTPQAYLHGNDLYAFDGHDTDINFAYATKLAGGNWTSLTKLTGLTADGSASIRWDPLHETDPSIIDATTYNEDRLGNRTFLGEVYYMAIKPSVADNTPPAVSLTAPAAGTVSGPVTVSANASDNIGVAGVTFKVDGSSIAPEDTTSPYSVSWDTTTATNATHVITAVARDAAGNTATSTSVTVTTSNAAPIPSPVGTLLFGATTALTPTDTNLPGQVEAFDVGAVTVGSLARLHVFLDAPLPPSLLVGLYLDNAGSPGTLASSTAIPAPVAGWNDVAFGPVALTLGKKYWVAILTPQGAANGPHFRDAKAGLGAGVFVGGLGLSALPTTWPAGGTKNTDGPMSAYGTS